MQKLSISATLTWHSSQVASQTIFFSFFSFSPNASSPGLRHIFHTHLTWNNSEILVDWILYRAYYKYNLLFIINNRHRINNIYCKLYMGMLVFIIKLHLDYVKCIEEGKHITLNTDSTQITWRTEGERGGLRCVIWGACAAVKYTLFQPYF